MEDQQWRESHDAVQTALSVWPDLAEARSVAEELNRRYPIVSVGVQELGIHVRADSHRPGPCVGTAAPRSLADTPTVRSSNVDGCRWRDQTPLGAARWSGGY